MACFHTAKSIAFLDGIVLQVILMLEAVLLMMTRSIDMHLAQPLFFIFYFYSKFILRHDMKSVLATTWKTLL